MELDRVKRNVASMAAQNAPESDIDDYIASEGTTVDAIRDYKPQPQFGAERALSDLKGATTAAFRGGVQGLTSGFVDEGQSAIAAGVASMSPEVEFKDAYKDAMAIFKQRREQSAKDYPLAYYPSEIAGGIKTGVTAAEKIGGAALAKSFATNPIKTASAVGALSGGIYGAGTGDGGAEERLKSAGISAGVGALAAPAGAYIGSKVPNVVSKFTRTENVNAGRSLEELVSEAENKSLAVKGDIISDSSGINKVIAKIQKDFPDNWREVVESWRKSDKPLAELYGSHTTTLAKGAAQFPSGKARADKYFEQEIAGAPERLKSAISKNISGVDNYHTTAEDLLKAGKAKAAPAYQRAFADKTGINDERLNQFLNQPELQSGMQKGLKIQRLESVAEGGAFNPEDYAIKSVNEAGDYVVGAPNMRTLDAGKRGLDAMIQEQTDATTGRVTELGRALIKTKAAYVDELKRVNPNYAEALNTAGDYFKVDSAIKNGKAFMNTDAEIIAKNLATMSPQEKEAYKIGVGKQLRDIIDNKYEGANPYNKVFGSKEQQKRLMNILSPEEYKGLESSLRAENRLYRMRNEVLGGSPTTSKALAAAEIAAGGADAISALTTGGIKGMGVGAARGYLSKAFSSLNDKTADAVSRLLYETDPTQKLLLMDRMLGDKALTTAEKQIVKSTYFKAQDLINQRTSGAVAATMATQPRESAN